MPSFTPGPWVAVGWQVEVCDDNVPDICNTDPETFGQHGRSSDERCANARLIAAAPDLLEVLRVYVEYDEYINGGGGDPRTDRLQVAKRAIAKATGSAS